MNTKLIKFPDQIPVDRAKEAELVREIRAQLELRDGTFIGKVVFASGSAGPKAWALLRPIGQAPEKVKPGKQIYANFTDLGPEVPDGRLYLEQIVTFTLDINSKRGPRAVEIQVLYDPLKEQRCKRAA